MLCFPTGSGRLAAATAAAAAATTTAHKPNPKHGASKPDDAAAQRQAKQDAVQQRVRTQDISTADALRGNGKRSTKPGSKAKAAEHEKQGAAAGACSTC